MALHFFTQRAGELLRDFDARIKQSDAKGKITTWEISSDGQYYTHKAAEWHQKAWFKPAMKNDRLTFYIIKPKSQNVTALVYAYYHGHLLETFLFHFDQLFSAGSASALPDSAGDICT